MSKKMLVLGAALVMTFSLCLPAMATDMAATDKEVADVTQAYGITEREVENFEENLAAAMKKIEGIEFTADEVVAIPISENLIIEVDGGASPTARSARSAVTQWHIWSNYHIKSAIGVEILTLTANGVFDCDGKTSTPVDAYSSYISFLWSVVDTTDEVKSTYTRSTFDSEFDIGIDPINITIQTARDVCILRCTPSGEGSWSWN